MKHGKTEVYLKKVIFFPQVRLLFHIHSKSDMVFLLQDIKSIGQENSRGCIHNSLFSSKALLNASVKIQMQTTFPLISKNKKNSHFIVWLLFFDYLPFSHNLVFKLLSYPKPYQTFLYLYSLILPFQSFHLSPAFYTKTNPLTYLLSQTIRNYLACNFF